MRNLKEKGQNFTRKERDRHEAIMMRINVVKPAPKIEEKRYKRLINKPLRGGNLQ